MMNGTMNCMGAMGSMGMESMGMESMGMMGPMGWTVWLFWILLFGLVIWGLFRLITTTNASSGSGETPLEALQRRYAEGDLSTEEYKERKRVLSQ